MAASLPFSHSSCKCLDAMGSSDFVFAKHLLVFGGEMWYFMKVFNQMIRETRIKLRRKMEKENVMKKMMAVSLAAYAVSVNAATFTGEIYWAYWDGYDDCDIWEESANSTDWRDGFVNVDGKREPASWSIDQFVYPVSIEPGETFSAEVVHITSTPDHIKSVKVYSDQDMLNLYKGGDDDNYYMRKFWPNNSTQATRAWVVVSLNTVTTGDTYTFDLAKSPIVNDPDYPKFYNPADGAGEPSSKWTVTSYANAFGVSLTGTRQVTKSVSFDVKISETGETFGQRVWNICCPFGNPGPDWDKLDKVDDNGGDGGLMAAIGLYFVTDEMIKNQSSGDSSGGGSSSSVVLDEWKKARVLNGVATRALANPIVGVFTVKCGKVNAKKGTASVSATYTPISGKKKTYKAQTVKVAGDEVTVNWDGLAVTIRGNEFSGSDGMDGGLSVESAKIGGNWTRTDSAVYVDMDKNVLPEGVQTSLLPDGEPVIAKNGKWSFATAASVKMLKNKETKEKELVVDTSKGKTNLSGIKLTYTPKAGTFKGSFKVYALQNNMLKKFSAKVNGLVVGDKGYGVATIPKVGDFAVTVE